MTQDQVTGCMHIYIYIYHHTVQVARVQVQYLRQWVDEKAPPVQVAEGEPPCVQVDYLRWWCFILQPLAQIVHLHTWWFHPLQLAPVMFSLTPTGADTKLMLRKLALCGGVFLGGGGRCIRVCGGGGCCYGVLVLGKCTGVSQRKY